MNKTCLSDTEARIEMLNERAKNDERKIKDLKLGESCYLLALINLLHLFHNGSLTREELRREQLELKKQLENYYVIESVHNYAVRIRNRYSPILTEAEKNGCEICKKIVRVFDGREK